MVWKSRLHRLPHGSRSISWAKFADPIYSALIGLGKPKHRAFMQDFGDLAKKHFGEHVFVECFDELIKTNPDGHWVCDDVRRTYELDKVRELGFKVVYVETPEDIRRARAVEQGLDFIPIHNSETEVPGMKQYADLVIDGTLPTKEIEKELRKLFK